MRCDSDKTRLVLWFPVATVQVDSVEEGNWLCRVAQEGPFHTKGQPGRKQRAALREAHQQDVKADMSRIPRK